MVRGVKLLLACPTNGGRGYKDRYTVSPFETDLNKRFVSGNNGLHHFFFFLRKAFLE